MLSTYIWLHTYYRFLSGSECLKIQNHQNHKPAFMINRTCEDLKPLLAATGSHFDTGVGPWQLSNRRFDEISEMVKPHSERVQISTSAPGIISDLCSRILMGYEWPQKAPSGDDAHSPSSWLRHHKSNEPNLSREFVVLNKPTNTGWWFQPFWKLWKSMGRMTSRKKKVWNHQPEQAHCSHRFREI